MQEEAVMASLCYHTGCMQIVNVTGAEFVLMHDLIIKLFHRFSMDLYIFSGGGIISKVHALTSVCSSN